MSWCTDMLFSIDFRALTLLIGMLIPVLFYMLTSLLRILLLKIEAND